MATTIYNGMYYIKIFKKAVKGRVLDLMPLSLSLSLFLSLSLSLGNLATLLAEQTWDRSVFSWALVSLGMLYFFNAL